MSGLLKRVIPCLDVDRGRVVKGVNFLDLREMGDPVELAAHYERDGADELVFLDISATAESRPTALAMVRAVARVLSIPFTVGGGLRELGDIAAFLDAGADKVALNTSAVADPSLVERAARQYGSQCLVVAIDVKRDSEGVHRVFTHGGRRASGLEAFAWSKELEGRGAGEILLTSMDRDGTGSGFDLEITGRVGLALKIPVIASGGASHPRDLLAALEAGADAVLAATIFHSGAHPIPATKAFLRAHGVPVREL